MSGAGAKATPTSRTMSKSAEGRVAQQEGEGPVVSVIVIFLDPGTFLNEAIESIRRQTFAHWEVVLVDDGSTDGSSGFARALCEQDPVRFRYLDHPGHENRGTSASRNAGLAAARGRYVAFLDADDVYLPTRLEAHVGILDSMPDIDMVQSDHLWWTSWQDERDQIDEDHMRPFAWAEDCIVSPPEALMTILAAPLSSTMPCSITVRRSTALAVGGFEACIHSLYEDQAFLTKIYIDKPIYAMNACLAKHRVHAASLMNSVAATASARQPGPFGLAETLHWAIWQPASGTGCANAPAGTWTQATSVPWLRGHVARPDKSVPAGCTPEFCLSKHHEA
jgi:hypothetical protein